MPDTTEALTAGLRAWTKNHDPHVRSAVELLIWHEFWLRRTDFTSRCIHGTSAGSWDKQATWIDWHAARAFVDKGTRASTSEMAILDLAVALGEDRYRLSIMGSAHSRAIADAVAQAVGVDR